MTIIGVRELRDHLSEYLRRVRDGELVVITDRGRPIGELSPVEKGTSVERARAFVRESRARWSGGKPSGLVNAPRPHDGSVAEAVLEDRR